MGKDDFVRRGNEDARQLGGVNADLDKWDSQGRKLGAGKGDHVSASRIHTKKYRDAMEANEAYVRDEITLEEWRYIVHGVKPKRRRKNE